MRRTASFFLPKPDGTRFGLTPVQRGRAANITVLAMLVVALPALANASPFDGMIQNVETLFTGTIATAGAAIACVIAGIAWATGDPGAKRNIAGVAFGIAMAIGALNVVTWLGA
jgi:type IV secretory pathway VirB2 component (pilin)